MKQLTCPRCGKEITGNHEYEVKCYQCGKYSYLSENKSFEEEKAKLYPIARQYAYAYVPENVREYVDKYGLAQSGPTTLKWFKDHEQEAYEKIVQFINERITGETLWTLQKQYDGKGPFLLYALDSLSFPIKRAPLDWDFEQSDSFDF
ncbi:hypothetical protein [Aneurinibacillus tyrosinisolvens]|uniref:hypothetical protein n=1 Tax=Aneurinibacillus tyrosinisolvens TaxID=1443435 RepID=UPI00063F70A2|nr:hypothetical protein [Aneurinibacillus tyrosinisolvens]